jgi:hypothetical protein
VLTLFVALEAVPMRSRKSDAFRDEDRRLHRLLNLYSEWRCSSVSVLDREAARSEIVSVGRIRWIGGTTMSGKQNFAWYRAARHPRFRHAAGNQPKLGELHPTAGRGRVE